MIPRVVTLAVLLALAPTSTASAATRAHSIDVDLRGNYTQTEPALVLVSSFSDSTLGEGGVVARSRPTGGGAFSGSSRFVDGAGTFNTQDAIRTTPQEGFLVVTGTWRAAGGTGRYARASGSGTISGTVDPDTGETHLAYSGKLRYDRSIPPRRSARRPRTHRYKASGVGAIAGVANASATVPCVMNGLTPGGGVLILEAPQGTVNARIRLTYYDGRGSISGYADIERQPQPDGTIKVVGRGGGFTRGKGLYKGVKHTRGQSLTGVRDAMGILRVSFSGALTY
jgi:hypothetical protein